MKKFGLVLLGGALLAGCGVAERVGLVTEKATPMSPGGSAISARTAPVFGSGTEAPEAPPETVPAVAGSVLPETYVPQPAPKPVEVITAAPAPAQEYIDVGKLPEQGAPPPVLAPAAYGTAF